MWTSGTCVNQVRNYSYYSCVSWKLVGVNVGSSRNMQVTVEQGQHLSRSSGFVEVGSFVTLLRLQVKWNFDQVMTQL